MRNDYPDHPAGPLDHIPDPNLVIVVRKHPMEYYIGMGCCGMLVLMGFMIAASMPQLWRMGLGIAAFSIPLYLFIDYVEGNQKPVLRIRPDGIEFPRDKLPPLHWSDIRYIDMAVVNFVGRGGPQDFLGITLHPYARPKGASPYISALGKIAMTMTQWNFDVIYPMRDFDQPVPHLVMEMRARAEAAAETPPQAPLGEKPIQPGRCATAKAKGTGAGTIFMSLFSGFNGLFGLLVCGNAIWRIVNRVPVKKITHDVSQLSHEAAFGVGAVFLAICYFTWPGDDEDETSQQ